MVSLSHGSCFHCGVVNRQCILDVLEGQEHGDARLSCRAEGVASSLHVVLSCMVGSQYDKRPLGHSAHEAYPVGSDKGIH